MSIVRTELRLLRHDPVPAAVLVGMPLVLMTLLSDAMKSTLATEGYPGVAGSSQTVPGMACVFASFAIAVVGFAIFREHGWRTWPRLRAAGLSGRALLAGKLAVPAGLVAAQHVVLFGFGVAFLDLRVSGSWLAVVLIGVAFGALVLVAGLAAAAALSTIQQVNAVTNLGRDGAGRARRRVRAGRVAAGLDRADRAHLPRLLGDGRLPDRDPRRRRRRRRARPAGRAASRSPPRSRGSRCGACGSTSPSAPGASPAASRCPSPRPPGASV